MMEAARRATIEDVPRLVALGEELVGATRAHRGGGLLIDPEGSGEAFAGRAGGWAARMGDGQSLVLVGTLDGAVVGFALSHVEDRVGHGRRGLLDACYVEPAARGVGVGHLLLDGSLGWMGERGCRSVDGVALPGDRGAKNFYETAGFKARLLTMHRDLG